MKIHCLGIGGIGVSALARYYFEKGQQVTGSDLVSSEITDSLKKIGVKIFIGPQKPIFLRWHLKQLPDFVVYSLATNEDNPELKSARKRGIKCLSYPEALGELTKKYFTIAISGSHGKSTTSAMIGLLLTKAGLDPTVILGTKLKEFGNTNCRVGKSQYLVIEADEHFAAFLNYWPKIIVLTNIEREHLDFYKNLGNILKTYQKYISHLPGEGILIVNKDDPNIKKIIKRLNNKKFSRASQKLLYFSLKDKEGEKLKKILKVPGKHNLYNALAALTLARALKIPDKISFKALSEYKGSWRRFETKNINLDKKRSIIIISDYGHHPTEIKTTLEAAREKYSKKQIWLIYQPHQYQRTYYLFKDFVKVFTELPVDNLIITDIYDVAGREKEEIKQKVSSKKLIQAINQKKIGGKKETAKLNLSPAKYIPSFKEVKKYLKKNLKGGEVVIIMGAGDIYNLFLELTKEKGKI